MAVSTIKSSGGDFTSVSAWESSKQADLTGNGPEEAECYNFQDTTVVTILGWTTTASDYIRIYSENSPGTNRHDGTSRDVSGNGYQLAANQTNGIMHNHEDFVRWDGLDFSNTSTASQATIM